MKRMAELRGSTRFIELEERHGAHNYHPLDVVIAKAEGSWVWDVDGNRYLDFLAAYSAVNQGHCHPRLVKVMQEQVEKVTLTSRAFRNNQLGPFCEELTSLTGFHRVLPMNTGAEAVETAIKAARKWGYTVKGIPEDEAEILVFEAISMVGRRRSSGFRPTTATGLDSGRMARGSASCPTAMLRRSRPPCTTRWLQCWSNRSRARPEW